MRTPARADRDLIARLLATVAVAAALCALFATLFAGCEGPGLEPPAHDRNNGMGPSSGGTLPPPVMTGGNGGSGGSFGNVDSSGRGGSGGQSAGGKGGSAGGSMMSGSGGSTAPGFDAGPSDEDAGVD